MLKEFLNSSCGKSRPFSQLDRASEKFPFLGGEGEAPRGKQDELHSMQEGEQRPGFGPFTYCWSEPARVHRLSWP